MVHNDQDLCLRGRCVEEDIHKGSHDSTAIERVPCCAIRWRSATYHMCVNVSQNGEAQRQGRRQASSCRRRAEQVACTLSQRLNILFTLQ